MNYSLILLSAGKGTRFGKNTPKQYLLLAGKPMIVRSLECADAIEEIKEIIIVCEEEYIGNIKDYLKNYRIRKKVVFAQGGKTRQQSVFEGLKAVSYDGVIVHEAARPLITKNDFLNLIQCKEENVTYVYEIPYTVLKKDQNNVLSGILNRSELVNIQLPQKFNKSDLLNAHILADERNEQYTEDASMVYHYSEKPVFCLKGKPYNIKMTEYTDLLYGEMLIKEEIVKEDV